MKKIRYSILSLVVSLLLGGSFVSSCSDDIPAASYFTFTGEMMSDFLHNHDEYKQFAQIVDRAGLTDLLSAYGTYTCFAPNNDAVKAYLAEVGLESVDEMTDEQCDTIARMHLMTSMYHTTDITGVLTLPTDNMLRRFIQVDSKLENDESRIVLNKRARIITELQNDSVENGIVQPVDAVILPSTDILSVLLRKDGHLELFSEAIEKTGLSKKLEAYVDNEWNADQYDEITYSSDTHTDKAWVPDYRNYGFTAFVVTDEVLREKYQIETIQQLYQYAYSQYAFGMTPDEQSKYATYNEANLKDEKNPLYRMMAYHLLDRLGFYDKLTTITTIDRDVANPTEWYRTMDPLAMIKVEQLTVPQYITSGIKNDLYINRSVNGRYNIPGSHILRETQGEESNIAVNGVYYYIDNLLSYNQEVREQVFNTRIRMDLSTIWPELMTNSIRGNGDNTNGNTQDPKYGRNYYFPAGYLDNMTVRSDGYFIYLRPHNNYWSYEGDEFNLIGNSYDIEFQLPPVPGGQEYEIRLGYCATATRGIAQVYYDNKPQGIPFDMRIFSNDPSIGWKNLEGVTDEEAIKENRKILKNNGYYRGPLSVFNFTRDGIPDGTITGEKQYFFHNFRTVRKVLCRTNISGDESHTLRIRSVYSEGQAEFMIDYLEIVPKSVYGVEIEGLEEDEY